MVIKLRTKRPDPVLRKIVTALKEYDAAHPDAEIEAYRHSSVSVRIRILDAGFAGKSRAEREDEIWDMLAKLPESVVAEISLLLLFTPKEARKSMANLEFVEPTPSEL